MKKLNKEYVTLVQYTADYVLQEQTTQRNLANAEQELEMAKKREKDNLQSQLQEISCALTRVRAFMAIAKSHCKNQIPSSKPIPYNNGVLSRLSVRINSDAWSVGCAEQLYTEATGQMQYLAARQGELCRKHDEEIKQLQDKYIRFVQNEKRNLKAAIVALNTYISSREFASFISQVKKEHAHFTSFSEDADVSASMLEESLSVGRVSYPVPCQKEIQKALHDYSQGLIKKDNTIDFPFYISVQKGSVVLAEYENEAEKTVLSGVQTIILNIIRYYRRSFKHILFVDPVRYNSSLLGCLSRLFDGQNGLYERVPSTSEEVWAVLQSKTKQLSSGNTQTDDETSKELLVFHDFPQGYDSRSIALIQQLCANAEHYGILVIVTTNVSIERPNKETMSYLRSQGTVLGVHEVDVWKNGKMLPFSWYSAPADLPECVRAMAEKEYQLCNLDNRYEERIGFRLTPAYKKGVREIKNIPFGLDKMGQVQTLDFEGHNFATYICGASRSGKSTLLHTLINGFVQNNHPDDIDIWLIDFGMTEFSRYIKHRPPHIRYILLDKSPELIYDIIDRLTTIMNARQRIYSGRWEKISDVPREKYFPAIMVVIDEFSVMSHVISDVSAVGSDGYKVKLEKLLSMGAKLGMYFIFSNQSFNGGARGLTEHAQLQIQQRIAMKTNYDEIKATLDIRDPSPVDETLMKDVPIHHALVKNKSDGKTLSFSHVLYTSDSNRQFEMIDAINAKMIACASVATYDATRVNEYILKKPLIKDGKRYISIREDRDEIKSIVADLHCTKMGDDSLVLFLGEPIRLEKVHPTFFYRETGENMLLIAAQNESAQAASIMKSILVSLSLQGVYGEIWSKNRNPCYRYLRECTFGAYTTRSELDDICGQISELKQLIMQKERGNHVFLLIGFETILFDMSFLEENKIDEITIAYGARKPDEPDLVTRMRRGDAVDAFKTVELDNFPIDVNENRIYDAREDLKYVLTYGPRFGYHFVTHFSSVVDFDQSRIPISIFDHKIMFRVPKIDASGIMGYSDAQYVAELETGSFRYSNGVDKLSFRPYLYEGLLWNGWIIKDGRVAQVHDDDEDNCV